jgi:subtilisin family serine protease
MGRQGTAFAVASCLALFALPAAAQAQRGALPAPERGQAVVEIAAAELPAGDGAAARQRWRELRADSARALTGFTERHGLDPLLRIPELGQVVVPLGNGSVADLRERLAGDPRVLSVRADRVPELRFAPNDPAFNRPDPNSPSGLTGQWNLIQSRAPQAWDMSRGAGAEVAVIDTGADVAHPDLAPRIAGTLDCVRPDPDDSPQCGGSGVADGEGHGTHVAGMACANTNNGTGIASVGFGCNLYIAAVNWCSGVAAAIVAAGNRQSDAINLSLGNCGPEVAGAIDYAWARGSVPVVAGTNTPFPGGSNYPAQAVQPEGTGPVIGSGKGLVVTSAKQSGQRSSFAQRSSGVSVAAYGSATDALSCGRQGILSTWPSATTGFDVDCSTRFPPAPIRTTIAGDNRYAYLVGTSMAAPQVAGLVALMRSAKPSLPAAKVVRLIKLTASNGGTYVSGLGWGLIDAEAAVGAALGRDVVSPGSKVKSLRRGHLRLKRFDKEGPAGVSASGVKTVIVYASVNGGSYRRVGKTGGKQLSFRPKPGRRYRFYSVAVDKAGNREPAPAKPDLKLRKRRR